MTFESVSLPEKDWEQCILALRCEVAALKFRLCLLRAADVARLEAKYSPDQPRVPAGNSDGGQWTDGGGDDAQGGAIISGGEGTDRLQGDSGYPIDLLAEEAHGGHTYLITQPCARF